MKLFKALLQETKRLLVKIEALREINRRKETSEKAKLFNLKQISKFTEQRERILQRIVRMRLDELGVKDDRTD